MRAARFLSPSIDVPTYRRLFIRALLLWAGVRALIVMAAAFVAMGSPGDPIVVGTGAATSMIAVALVVFLSDLDVRATREALFLAHLGIGRRHIAAVTATIAGPAELAFRIAVGAVFS